MIELVCGLLTGVLLGYLLGWHRGALRMPLAPSLWPRRTASKAPLPSSPEEPEPKADQIKNWVKQTHPELLPKQVDAAVAEIETKGRQVHSKALRLDRAPGGP